MGQMNRPGAGFAAMRMTDALQVYPNPHGENPNPGKDHTTSPALKIRMSFVP